MKPAAAQPIPQNVNFLSVAMSHTRRAFWFVALFSFAINMLVTALPLYSMQVLDRVFSSRSIETLLMLTFITLAMIVFYALFNFARSAVLARISEWLEIRLAPDFITLAISKAALGVPASAGQSLRDLNTVKSFIVSGTSTLFDAPWAIIFLLIVYMINPILGAITLAGCVILFAFAWLTEFATKKPLKIAQNIAIRSVGIADIASRNAEAIEAMGMMGSVIANWEHHNKRNLDLQTVAVNRNNVIQSISRGIRLILQIAITGVGAALALYHNEITVGGMIAASILAGRALAPFEAAIGIWKSWIGTRDAYERLNKAIETTSHFRGSMALPAPKGDLSVENVFYRPANNDKFILKGVSFRLNAGESLGIIGPSAAGKSTLAKLIIGILPPTNGAIRLDGAEVFKWNRQDFGQYVGYMPQEVELFGGTIKDNIARLDANASDDAVIHAAQMAGVHELILRLPKGYETEFAPGNQTLSPGQRQRIGLARALYGNPRFIVLDEPNSNLDGDGEKSLIAALQRIKAQGITSIVVAHRPSIVSNVDRLLILRDGTIEQFGPRDQVLQKYVAPPTLQTIAQQQAAPKPGGAS